MQCSVVTLIKSDGTELNLKRENIQGTEQGQAGHHKIFLIALEIIVTMDYKELKNKVFTNCYKV